VVQHTSTQKKVTFHSGKRQSHVELAIKNKEYKFLGYDSNGMRGDVSTVKMYNKILHSVRKLSIESDFLLDIFRLKEDNIVFGRNLGTALHLALCQIYYNRLFKLIIKLFLYFQLFIYYSNSFIV